MKTRKVGKIVSLLVAIVLVATIMIPAAGVLADNAADKSFDDSNCIEVSNYDALKSALDNASTDGSKTYIKLQSDISLGIPFNHGSRGDSEVSYFAFEAMKVTAYLKTRINWAGSTVKDEWLNIADFVSELQSTNPALYKTLMSYNEKEAFLRVSKDTLSLFDKTFGNLKEDKWSDPKYGGKPEYEDNQLVVHENTNVVIDLNGHGIVGVNNNATAYTSTPSYQSTVFVVKGTLTIMDRSPEQVGYISGGTGYVIDSCSLYDNEFDGWKHSSINSDWKYLAQNSDHVTFNSGTWRHIDHSRHTYWYYNATESKGGGINVQDGGTLNLVSGKITKNVAFMSTDESIFKAGITAVAKGGGVYVSDGGTFNMYGGEITQNVARAYQKESNAQESHAYGGGVYVEAAADGKAATFNMYGGKIAENATYAETYSSGKTKSVVSEGAGIYVGTGSVCNIMGSADAEGPTTSAMLASFPQITNNSCGAITRNGVREGATVTVQGAGIYCDGTLNIKKALVSSNDFSEFSRNVASSNFVPAGNNTTHIMRDEETGLPLYIYDYNDDGSAKTYVTRLDARFTENLELATEQVVHETSGIYGTARGNENNKLTSDGAGVYLGTTARMNVGERTWITGNYDLVTTGHKAFDETRNYAMHWDKTANGGAGGYVYTAFAEGAGNGYTWSDTSDDVYLPEGVTMYKGDSLFESRIGVNYYDMVDKEGDVSVDPTGRASNRVIVKSATDLDYNLWGATSSTPMQTDIQFFSLNDNNKNYERDNYADLPTRQTVTLDSVTCELLYLTLTPEGKLPSWAQRTLYRVAVIDTDKFKDEQGQYRKKYLSPYQGYVDFETVYHAGRFVYTTEVRYNDPSNNDPYIPYNKETYFKADPEKNPTTAAMANKNVVFPQRAYQIDATASQLSKSEQRAKFMDYKVIYDDNGFGSDAAPVLRFGKGDRQMYVTYNFDEADKTYYGENVDNKSLNEAINIDSLITGKSVFKIINRAEDGSSFTFYGANRPTGTIMFNKIVPDYKAYKASNVLADRIANRKSELTSITKTDGKHEDKDLYFKGWSFYTSYGYGPEIVTLNNKDALQSINIDAAHSGSSLDYRGTFTADLSKIINQNVNAQPCPSMTATWYTKEELAEARKKVSNVMFQTVQRQNDDGTTTNLLRAVALAGSQYLDFDEVGFVISTTNATPTIEGGYDYVVKSRVYEKLGVNRTAGAAKTYYDVDKLLGGTWSGQTSVKIEDKAWTFTEGSSEFAANVTTGATGKAGYKDAGLFYTNIVITDANKDTVYFVTPYAKMGNTYYYGESRAACYTDAPTA
ncbi:MAG: hypothetical protein MSA66_07555 [Oscillospiraceae bacterium]|nr:hypothetical protein [Oscillospiraceae bacterium]